MLIFVDFIHLHDIFSVFPNYKYSTSLLVLENLVYQSHDIFNFIF